MFNKVILMGRLTKDPEFKQTPSDVAVCTFSVAINKQFTNKQTGEKVDDTTFVDCVAWRNTAEFVARYFTKGSMILVEGALKNNNYTDNNNVKHYSMKVQVDNVDFTGSKQESGGGGQQTNHGVSQAYQPQTAQGDYNAPYAPQAPQQVQTYQQQTMPQQNAQRSAQTAPAQQQNLSIGDIGQFEEILSDGQLPF